MRSGFRSRAAFALRAIALAVMLSALAPKPADAADLWCWLFGCGDSGSRSSEQALPGRSAPEIDPCALASAIALAVGGAALVSDRVRRRRQ